MKDLRFMEIGHIEGINGRYIEMISTDGQSIMLQLERIPVFLEKLNSFHEKHLAANSSKKHGAKE